MKKSILLFLVSSFFVSAKATTYYTVANGAWGGAIWSSVCSTCAGSVLPALSANDVLIIDDQVTIASGTVTITPTVSVILRTDNSPNTSTNPAKLIFVTGGKLNLSSSGSSVTLQNVTGNAANNPIIDGSGSGGSNTIDVGGTELWRASNGDVQGVGTLSPGGTLPVKLISFKVDNISNASVNLKWITAYEQNFDYFLVERAGLDLNFETLSKIEGKGGLDITTSYEYQDREPLSGKNYYRLKRVDLDWSYEYSNVILAEWSFDDHKPEITIYPNPITNHKFTIVINHEVTSYISIILLNSVGKEISQQSIAKNKEVISLQDDLKPGVYYLQIIGSDFNETIKVLIQ
ncbi:MAG: T9SS type A sorting domain-containing protein [Chryseolinea sp.]